MLMTARMTNPAFAVDGAMDALNAVARTISRARVPISRELVHLRASQINGCSVCVDMHAKALRKAGESEERVFAVGAWRETPFFSAAERAALVAAHPEPASLLVVTSDTELAGRVRERGAEVVGARWLLDRI